MKTALSALALCAAMTTPALAFDITDMSTEERAAFRAEIRAYLLDNPEVIMEAVAVLEARQQAQAQQNDALLVQVNADALFDDGFSWVGGNPDGDVTLVEFTDYRCAYCRKAHDEVSELVASDGNIRLIVKEFPILGDASTISSQFAIATRLVAGDAAYKTMHDALITLQGEPSDPALRRLATSLGLDADAIFAKMQSPEVERVIAETRQLAGRLQISGTPTFVMGDQMLRGYVPLDTMQGLVADIRDKG